MRDVDFVELAPRMGPARDFDDRSIFIKLLEAGICVGLERTLVEPSDAALRFSPLRSGESANQTAGAVVSPDGRSSRT